MSNVIRQQNPPPPLTRKERALEDRPVDRLPAFLPEVAGTDSVFRELSEELFASLRRSDQRRKGLSYLRGLLATPGRKSIRNMATLMGGSGTGQSLHHFICSSTWEWPSVRRALAEYLVRVAPPRAWVVRPLIIPKSGWRSVGVGRYFSPANGHSVSAQQAIGVWLASDTASIPVEWRLHLPEPWRCGTGEETPAPDTAAGDEWADCAADSCLDLVSNWQLPRRQVILDLDDSDPIPALRRLRAARLHPVARIPGDLPLTVADSALTGHTGRTLPAWQIMRSAHRLRRPVTGVSRPPDRSAHRSELVATVRVALPDAGPLSAASNAGAGFTLVGEGPMGRGWPGELWLAALPPEHAAISVPRSGRLLRQTDRAVADIGDHVGLRDYAGRSFDGWHRHITLASAAHAVVALSASRQEADRPAVPTALHT